jgi:hypothetical protein
MSNELKLNLQLLNDVRRLIISARMRVAQVVNSELPSYKFIIYLVYKKQLSAIVAYCKNIIYFNDKQIIRAKPL